MTVLEKLTGPTVLGAGGDEGCAGVLDSAGVSVVTSTAGVDEEGAGEGTAMSVEGAAVIETAALFVAVDDCKVEEVVVVVDEAEALSEADEDTVAEEEALGLGPLTAPHVATLGPGMVYGFLPLSGVPVLP